MHTFEHQEKDMTQYIKTKIIFKHFINKRSQYKEEGKHGHPN